MKMRDTFTKILPSYNHEPRSCYNPSFSHYKHIHFLKDIEGKPFAKGTKEYNHKMDEIKTYSEEMLRLGEFAPKPVKGVPKK